MEFPQVVDLNVGGRHLTTTLATLTKYPDSMLAAMFSGRHRVYKDKDGRYFIDVNGDVFVYILDFLRLQTMPPPDRADEVKKYAEYFGIEALSTRLYDLSLPSEDALFAQWASRIHGYSKYLKDVRNSIKECQVSSYIVLQMLFRQCKRTNCEHCIDSYHFDNQLQHRWSTKFFKNIDIPTQSGTYLNSSEIDFLLQVLSHDLKKMGIYLWKELCAVNSCCKRGRIFRVGS